MTLSLLGMRLNVLVAPCALETAAEACAHMLSGKAQFRVVPPM